MRSEFMIPLLRLPRSDHSRAVGILHLDPVPRPTRTVGRGEPLRHHALEAHAARVPEDRSAVIVGVIAEHDAEPAPPSNLTRRFLRSPSGLPRRSSPSNSMRSKA